MSKGRKKKKINPCNRPATQADVNRAKKKAEENALSLAMALFLTVLLDKEHADKETIQRVWKEVEDLSDSVVKGYVNLNELRTTLREEYEILI